MMTASSGLAVEVDNSSKSSATKISGIVVNDGGVRDTSDELQLQERSERLHEVAKQITFRKKKAKSGALGNYRTVEAR